MRDGEPFSLLSAGLQKLWSASTEDLDCLEEGERKKKKKGKRGEGGERERKNENLVDDLWP